MGTIGTPESGVTGSSAITTETQLLNDALGLSGGNTRITNIDDGSINANHCVTFYGPLRDGLLRSHHWNFAVKRAKLAQNLITPLSGFAYSYKLPADNLKIIDYGGANPVAANVPLTIYWYGVRYLAYFKIESGNLLSNDGVAYIMYLRRVTNPAEWDAMFYQAVALALASKLAMAIRKDERAALALSQQADAKLLMAMAVDGQEGSVEPFVSDDLTWGR